MEIPSDADILSSDTFLNVLADSPFADDAEIIRNTLRELHHQYLEAKLAGDRTQPEVNHTLLEDVAYYLSGIATVPGRSEQLEPSLRLQMLSVSALVFEYLGDMASSRSRSSGNLDDSGLYYLDACICNTLGLYEANTIALAHKYLLRQQDWDDLLHGTDSNLTQKSCHTVLYAWLARQMSSLWLGRRSLEKVIEKTISDLAEKLASGRVSRRTYSEMRFWIGLVDAVVTHSRFFQFGKEDYLASASEKFSYVIDQAVKQNNPPLVWMAYALQKCSVKMSENSVWKRLSPICSRRYLRSLVTSPTPVFELWTSQIAAIEAQPETDNLPESKLEFGVLDPRVQRVVIGMPTSSGKTLLAELSIIRTLFPDAQNPKPLAGTTCIYVVPSLALVNQVEARLQARLLPLNVRVTAIVGGYDAARLDDALLDKTRVAVLTPEKLDMLIREDHPFIQQCRLYVFDEIHKVNDLGRGLTLELIITWLKDFHPQAQKAKMVFMSAVMPNFTQIAMWVEGKSVSNKEVPVLSISVPWQPTRQVIGYLEIDHNDIVESVEQRNSIQYWRGGHLNYVAERDDLANPRQIRRLIRSKETFKILQRGANAGKRQRDSKNSFGVEENAVEIAKRFIGANLDPVLVFFMSREETRNFCMHMAASEDYAPKNLNEREQSEFNFFIQYLRERLGDKHPLAELATRGIAYHHGYLPQDVRAEIEYAFFRRWIRVMASTTTLTDGVNFPISTFILANYEQTIGSEKTADAPRPILIRRALGKKDFKNMIGRAGRAVFDTEGQIVFMLPLRSFTSDQSWQDYLFPREDDAEWQVRSSLEHKDFRRDVLQQILQTMQSTTELIGSLEIDPDALNVQLGNGAADVGETILRLQAFLLAVTDRDIIDPENVETIRKFFGKMLLGHGQNDEDLMRLVTEFTRMTSRALVIAEPSSKRRAYYGKIGLGFSSARSIFEKAQEFWMREGQNAIDTETEFLTFDFVKDIGLFLFAFPEVRPHRVKVPRTRPTKYLELPHGEILAKWTIFSESLSSIRDTYFGAINDLGERAEMTANYIRDSFEYKAPWAFSAFYTFVAAMAQDDNVQDFGTKPLGRQLSMLPAYTKFGVNNPASAFFSMLGINVRKMTIVLGNHFNLDNPGRSFDFSQMLNWLLDLEPEEVMQWYTTQYGQDNAGQIPRLFRLLEAIRSREQSLEDILPLDLYIKGWKYYDGPSIIAQMVAGEELVLKPDPLNPWDKYAVEVFNKLGRKLGMIPRELSQAVFTHIVSSLPLRCVVAELNLDEKFHPVKVRLEASEFE